MLNFLIGRACTGKTHKIIETTAKTSSHKKVVLIVPEQFTFESERAMIKYSDAVLDNISVLSFSRLFDFVAEATGRGAAQCVSDFEKMILLKKALVASSEQLSVFSRYIKYRDFVKSVSDTIRDFKFAGANADDLLRAARDIGGTCGAKLEDLSCIMSAYDALLSEKYIDPADKLTKLYEILCGFEYFKDTDVFFDSFTGFTGQQYKIIGKILEQADNVTFSFCADDDNDLSLGVFYNTCTAIENIKKIASANGIKDVAVEKLTASYYSNEAMKNLEKLMFASADNCISDGNVNVIACENSRQEALAAANIIRREVKENGYRFRDFILVARNSDTYADDVLRQCEKHGISCFTDRKFSLAYTPVCNYVLRLIDVAISMSSENVLSLLKTGLFDLSDEEIFELENYVYIWDIVAADWQEEWDMSVKGITADEDSDSSKAKLSRINATRQKVYKIISDFKSEFSGTPQKRATAIYKHLTSMKIDDKLATALKKLTDDNEHYLASVNRQSWDSFIAVLDSIVRVMDKTSVSTDEFYETMLIAVDAVHIANIPQMLDEVTFGSAERIRPSKPKISIVMGANHGVFPFVGSAKGLLAASDKEKLKKFDIDLADDVIKGAVEENYLVYSMLCCPVDKVYVLYAEKDSLGKAQAPSSFVSRITDAFVDIKVQTEGNDSKKTIKKFSISASGEFLPATAASAYNEIGIVNESEYVSVKESVRGYENYFERLELIEKSSSDIDFSISPATSDKLFGKEINLSATGFDIYHKCSLSYLLKQGIQAKKIEKADLGVLQRGLITHYVLEKIVDKFHSKLGSLTPAEISSEVDVLISDYFDNVKGSDKLMTARFSFLLSKIALQIKNIVAHMASEFAQSGFDAKYCELTIGNKEDIPGLKYILDDGSVINFEGKIDRVDVFGGYVRVVDYKTGKMVFKLSDTLVGLNMQMLLYLYNFVKCGNELVNEPIPAGVLYMPAKDSEKPAERRMNGIILDKDEVRLAMEKENKGRYIPKKDDKAPSASYLQEGGFEVIFDQIDKLVISMGNSLRNGKFSANPTDGSSFDACKYCNFSGICRSSGNPHKKSEEYDNEKTISILKGGE